MNATAATGKAETRVTGKIAPVIEEGREASAEAEEVVVRTLALMATGPDPQPHESSLKEDPEVAN